MIIVPKLKSDPAELKELNNYLVRLNGKELTSLHTPCYQPTMIKYMADLRKLTGIEQKDMDIFFNSLTAKYMADFKILKNDITSIIIIGIIFYSRIKRYDIAESLYILLSIRFYTNRFSKHWLKYCKTDTWDLALRNLSQKHLFKVRNGISSTLLYLASVEYKNNRYKIESTKLTDKEFIDAIYMLRHRVAQSVRSFANRYYDIEQDTSNTDKKDDQNMNVELANINLLADNISEKICSYSQIDKNALDESIDKSRIRRELATEIINSLSNIQHKDDVRFIIILISKLVNMKDLCTKQPFIIRKIVQNNTKISNYSIKDQMLMISDNMYLSITKTINKDQLTLLLATYITTYVKNRIC